MASAESDQVAPAEITQEISTGRLLTADQARARVLVWGPSFYTALSTLPSDAPKIAVGDMLLSASQYVSQLVSPASW